MATASSPFRPSRRELLRWSAALAGAASLPPLWSCRTGASGKRVLTATIYAPPSTTDPAFGLGNGDSFFHGLLYNGLTRYTTGGSAWGWQPELARALEEVDPTHLRFELHPGVTFTDGFGEVTADDVKFSIERILDPKLGVPERAAWGPTSHVEVTGRYSGVIVLSEPFPALAMVALPGGSGRIVSRKAVSAMPGGRLRWEAVAASGPYVLGEWREKQRLVLRRNPEWRGAPPPFDEIRVPQIFDEKIQELGFEAGDLDFTGASESSYPVLRARPLAGTHLDLRPTLFYSWLGMNLEHPALRDLRVRQAIQHAVDVRQVVDAATFGTGEPSTGIVAPGLIGHRDRALVPPEGDVPRARDLLEQAGLAEGLDITLDCQNITREVTAAQVIQSCLARVRIRVAIRMHEAASFVTLGAEASGERWREIQLYLQRFSMLPDPFYATTWFTSEQVGVWNWERFASAEFDDLHRRATVELDAVERDRMIRRAQDVMEESGAYRFLTHGAFPVLWRDGLRPALRPDGQPLFRYFEAG